MFDLKLGFQCNNNCKHCVVANKRASGNMPLQEIFNILDKLPEGTQVQITGGEPSTFSTLPEILKYAKCRGLYNCLQTNATGFADKEYFEKCRPYIDHAHVAIHSCYPEVHDEIVGSKGMWQKTIDGFHNLLNAGISCTTQTVLSKFNIETLYDTFSFIQKECPGIQMSMTYPHLNGNAWDNREEVAFRFIDHKDVIQKTLKEFSGLIFTEAIPFCHLHPYVENSSAEKEILLDNGRTGIDFSEGKEVRNYNYLDIKEKRKAPRCKECIYNSVCIGVWKEYIQMFKNNLDLYPILGEETK